MKPEQRQRIMEKAVKALQAGKFSQAFSTINKINQLKSQQNFQSLELAAYSLFQQQKFERARDAYQQALALCDNLQQRNNCYKNIGLAEQQLGLLQAAIASFEQCFTLIDGADNADIASPLGECYLAEGRFQQLSELCAKMRHWPGQLAKALALEISAAKLQNQRQQTLDGIEALLQHSALIEEWQVAFAIDTLMFIREHQRAEQLLQQAAIDYPNKSWIVYYRAELALRQKHPEQCIELLSDELINQLDFMRKKAAYKLRADAKDLLQDYSAAFNDYSAMAALNHQRAQMQSHQDLVAPYQKLDLNFIKQQPPLAQNDAEPEPVFMMGFNRSGTTLLENILDTQQRVIALSETRSLYSVGEAMSQQLNKRYPEDLATLSPSERQLLRQGYYDYIMELGFELKPDSVIVDKFPLYTVELPLILSLFPKAKIIFCLRHPADVCLSNFQQNSANNQQQAKLNRLADCFSYYQQVFTLFQRYQQQLDLNIHYVRYEDLVEDLEPQAEALFEFLNLSVCEDYRQFNQHAQQKIVMSASSNQVVEEIYQHSRYKWLNYQTQLQPHLAKVAQFVEQFAYPPLS
ncbi:sulfotransferase family protein [Agarivorans gilvus]|uniref:Sulfotransferase n=1 Tax=Agarivorans gilvus TaxID=680279 RepID=A0ABQ1HZI0_9ALTE|nr:sulfotransferase [Agarivorans gilvus]GGB01982.1 sulfotransferase [Agarivorans gilvus]